MTRASARPGLLATRLAHLACLAVFAAPLAGQTRIIGVVKEDSTARAIPGVEVTVERSSRQARTDSAGNYVVESPAGTQVVLFRLVGFRPLRIRVLVKKDEASRVDADLVRDLGGAQPLDPVSVTGRARALGIGRDAFGERRALGIGNFVDSTELRRNEGRKLSDVLRGSTTVRIVKYRDQFVDARGLPRYGPEQWRAVSPTSSDNGCWVSVIYDNVTIYRSGSRTPPPDFSREFSVSGLESIEFYRTPAQTPMEFNGPGNDCGVLVLWSRRGR